MIAVVSREPKAPTHTTFVVKSSAAIGRGGLKARTLGGQGLTNSVMAQGLSRRVHSGRSKLIMSGVTQHVLMTTRRSAFPAKSAVGAGYSAGYGRGIRRIYHTSWV
jgi:hypothetical protein